MIARGGLRLSEIKGSVWLVVVVGSSFYVIFTLAALGMHNWDPFWFLWIGDRFSDLNPSGKTGYDGQFAYYISRDWLSAASHLDNAPYRLQRILHPVLGWLASSGQPGLLPWALILLNLAAITGATYAIGRWFSSEKVSPWYALSFTLFLGLFLAYSRALTEPVAFALAACGTVFWLKRSYPAAILLLAAASLGKETAFLFIAGIAVAEAVQRRFLAASAVLAAALPLLAWEVWLYSQFHVIPIASGPTIERVPLSGVIPYLTTEPGRLSSFLFVGLPGLALLIMAAVWLIRDHSSRWGWLVLAQAAFVVLMPFAVYDHVMASGRNATGLALASTMAIPSMSARGRLLLAVSWAAPTLPWLVMVVKWAP